MLPQPPLLPALSRLSLNAKSPMSTGGFVRLTEEDLVDLANDHWIDPITHDIFTAEDLDRSTFDERATFAIYYQTGDGKTKMRVYNARALWKWSLQNPTDPYTMKPLKLEDRQALRKRFALHSVPTTKDGRRVLTYYEGRGDWKRKLREELKGGDAPDEMRTFKGPPKEEALVQIALKGNPAQKSYFVGPKGEEHLVLRMMEPGPTEHYAGAKGEEHLTKRELANGRVEMYEGKRGMERKVRDTHWGGEWRYFDGPKGAERLVKVVTGNRTGYLTHKLYAGPKGAESLTEIQYPNGDTEYYQGQKNREELKATRTSDGTVTMHNTAPPSAKRRTWDDDEGASPRERASASGRRRVGF